MRIPYLTHVPFDQCVRFSCEKTFVHIKRSQFRSVALLNPFVCVSRIMSFLLMEEFMSSLLESRREVVAV